ncbi:MAG: choice-of-anchor J domain-containing protein [Paludibacter sp.]|nr:choice-of-anchor J domain-containing protein [Paludibacter sp.]
MKKKFTLFIALALIFSAAIAQQNQRARIGEAQRIDPAVPSSGMSLMKSVEALTPAMPEFSAPVPPMRGDAQLKYINGAIYTAVGNTSLTTTTYYFNGCISFTETQMVNYVGSTLTQISVGVPPTSALYGSTIASAKVWIKSSLSGTTLYEQTFTPTVGSSYAYNDVTLTTPQTINSGAFVIGFTYVVNVAATTAYALPCSQGTVDPYQPGGFNYIVSTSANAYKDGSPWNTFTGQGNLAIVGYLTNVATLPTNDLSVLSVTSNPLKWVGNAIDYRVTISNSGTASQNNYAVQLIDDADNVVASQNVTTALAAGATTNITVNYAPTTVGNLSLKGKVVLTGDEISANNISEPLTQMIYPEKPIAYCDNSPASGVAWGANLAHQAAISCFAADMAPFAGKKLTAIDVTFGVPASTLSACSVWIRSSLTGDNLYSQDFTPSSDGWNHVILNTPYSLTNTDIYIGWSGKSTQNYIIGTTANTPQNAANGGHIQGGTNPWSTLALQSMPYNNAIVGVVESEAPSQVTITTAVSPENSGTVTGGGDYNVGDAVTLTATPNSGYSFVNWNTGSTDNPLTFNASVNATYTANFQTSEGPCDGMTLPFAEGFEGSVFPPDCWTNIDADGDGYSWVINDPAITAHSGTQCATSASYDNPTYSPLTPNNYLITPKLILPSGIIALSFWVAAQDPAYPADHYSVKVSTTDTNPTSFTQIFDETLTAGTSDWVERTIDLSAYALQNIYVAFVHDNCTNEFVMKLDDISVDIVIGLNDNTANNITVYPNPVSSTFVITNAAGSRAKIYDVSGKTVLELPVQDAYQTVDISNVSAGVYFLELQGQTSKSTVKLIKK